MELSHSGEHPPATAPNFKGQSSSFYKRMGEDILQIRIKAGKTQDDVARKTKISITRISDLENGRAKLMKLSEINAIARLCGDEVENHTQCLSSDPTLRDILAAAVVAGVEPSLSFKSQKSNLPS